MKSMNLNAMTVVILYGSSLHSQALLIKYPYTKNFQIQVIS